MSKAPRRVVTGLNEDGKSCIIIDGSVPFDTPYANFIWTTDSIPADNSGNEDAAVPYDNAVLHRGGSTFLVSGLPPGLETDAFMHATDTLDYLVVLSGEVVLVLETGEVTLRAGDFIVDRGVIHGWRNDGDVPSVTACVTIPAKPVGNGRTI